VIQLMVDYYEFRPRPTFPAYSLESSITTSEGSEGGNLDVVRPRADRNSMASTLTASTIMSLLSSGEMEDFSATLGPPRPPSEWYEKGANP
jgi:hypothetical protein